MKKLVTSIFFSVLANLSLTEALAQSDTSNSQLRIEQSSNNDEGRFALWLMPRQILDATVTISGTLNNMQTTPTLPCTFSITERKFPTAKPAALVVGQKYFIDKPFNYNWQYYWRLGVPGGKPDGTAYILPFQKGTSHVVAQGYGGTISHTAGTDKEFAIDFNMPIGTTVCSARSGRVIATKIDSNSGGMLEEQFKNSSNYIIIRHSDGTYGGYEHLKQNGALVRVGKLVNAGDAIGLSGNTGMSKGPHLHFEVFVPLDGIRKRTLPVRFLTATGEQLRLIQGDTYTN